MKLAPLDSEHRELLIHAKNSILSQMVPFHIAGHKLYTVWPVTLVSIKFAEMALHWYWRNLNLAI